LVGPRVVLCGSCGKMENLMRGQTYPWDSAEGIVSFLAEDVHDGLEGKPLRDVLA